MRRDRRLDVAPRVEERGARAVARRAVGEASVGDGFLKPAAAPDRRLETPAAVQEVAEPELAHDVVVLVEGGGVDAERDAAAAPDRLADRGDAAGEMQVRA